VASIIGGAFIILIILSAYAFFVFNNMETNDLQETRRYMSQMDEERVQEKVSFSEVTINGVTGLKFTVTNISSKLITLNYTCTLKTSDQYTQYTWNIIRQQDLYAYLDPGKPTLIELTNIDTSGTYQIDLISDKGSVFTVFYIP
jgi:uncharacterized membrane protein YqhA